ncbi:MAG: hypothetical protein WC729_30050 [Sphingomonas sp.]|uniref:hypothetical protein n=1 Tax=Sphingomonas sp. TaxID=28214 RepID=UPI003564B251
MRDAVADPEAWLRFVVSQLREHDNRWPKSLDSDDGLSLSDRASRDSLRARWEAQRDLIVQDVKRASDVVGLVVDVLGYPMFPEPVKPESRNGFLSPEDVASLFAQKEERERREASAAMPFAGDALEGAMHLLAPILDGLRERLGREREQSRAVGDDGELRFKQVIVVNGSERMRSEPVLIGLDMEGRMWSVVHVGGLSLPGWRRLPCVPVEG